MVELVNLLQELLILVMEAAAVMHQIQPQEAQQEGLELSLLGIQFHHLRQLCQILP